MERSGIRESATRIAPHRSFIRLRKISLVIIQDEAKPRSGILS